MEKRIVQAFDQITMPESCTRKIRQRLEQPPVKPKGYTMVLDQRKEKSWKQALAAACVLLLLLSLPVAYLGRGEENPMPEATSPEATEETMVRETLDGLPFWEEGREILDPLCRNMPDWKGYASLEDSFWTELVVRTLNGYAEDEKGELQTQAGPVSLVAGRIRMDREHLSAYTEKIMGLPLPEFTPCGVYGDLLSYEGGAYYAANTVFSDLTYCLKDWTNGKFPEVTYSIHPAPGGEELGTVTFLLSQGEQERDYLVLDKTTNGRRVPQESSEMEAVAREYAKAYFANDMEAIVNHMTSRSDWPLALNLMVQNMYTGSYFSGWNETSYQIEDVTAYGFPWDNRDPVVYVTYSWHREDSSGSYALILYMTQTAQGWKVRFSDEGSADSYDPDRLEIQSAACNLAWGYASEDLTQMQEYLTSNYTNPPVHVCTTPETRYPNGAGYTNVETTVYYDPDTPDPATGELRAQVWVEFSASDQDLNGDVLILNMVKKEEGWKADHISEG